ncbi:MAG: BACON domain-containing protein, partial [Planctomycetaceae bacterium]|nr:BACON domain-containing protein [Planctomycetaceae bacterium]
MAIGAYHNSGTDTNAGHVRIYGLSGNTWIKLGQDIDGEAAGDISGWSVSLSADGHRVAIGAPRNAGQSQTGPNAGHVRIYDLSGNTWTKLEKDIDGEYVGEYTGEAVSLNADGNRVAIGAPEPRKGRGGRVSVHQFPASLVTLDPYIRSIPATGSNGTFTVSSSTSWNWSDNASWLTSNEATTQSGNQIFSYSVAANTTTQPRSATITITAGNITRSHTVTQEGVQVTLALSPTARNFAADGGNFTLNVTSNASWSWSDNATWLTSSERTTQDGNQSFSYSLAANPSTQSRSATITFTAGNITRSHIVTQEGATATLALSPTSRSIAAEGGNFTFNITSNTSWNWSDNASWLTSSEATTQSGNQIFTYSVAANPSTQSRSATITITAGNITRSHTVTQEGAGNALALSPTSRSIVAVGGNFTFNVTSNTSWNWSDNAAWLTSNEATAQSGNQGFSYSVAANTSTQSRSATITITAGNITRIHTVTQEGVPATLVLSPDSRSISAGGGNATFNVSSNTSWSWSDNATWLTSSETTTQDGAQAFFYFVAANNSTQPRSATITITAGNTIRIHTLTQAAGLEVDPALDPAEAVADAAGGELSFAVNLADGVDWTAESAAEWLTITGNSTGTGPGTVIYTVNRNSTTEEREGQIRVTMAGEEKDSTLNDGLVAYYPFNGNANDESGNGNNGTVNGATLSTDRNGNAASAYDFDGFSIISVPDSDSLDLEK